MPKSPNPILNALSQNIFVAMEPHLRNARLAFGDVVAETGDPVNNVYFPFTGVVSLVVEMKVGEMIETAVAGVTEWSTAPPPSMVKCHCTRGSFRLPVKRQ